MNFILRLRSTVQSHQSLSAEKLILCCSSCCLWQPHVKAGQVITMIFLSQVECSREMTIQQRS